MAQHCTECGFVNDDSANYCQSCGAHLADAAASGESVTATYRIDDAGELVPVEIGEVTAHGPALVIRMASKTPDTQRIDTSRSTAESLFIY